MPSSMIRNLEGGDYIKRCFDIALSERHTGMDQQRLSFQILISMFPIIYIYSSIVIYTVNSRGQCYSVKVLTAYPSQMSSMDKYY